MTASTMLPRRRLDFDLPTDREAREPPERRGVARDRVRLMVARPDIVAHTRFHHVGDHLQRGDLVVVNTSPTMAAALDGTLVNGHPRHGRRPVVVHLSTRRADGWEVELRRPDGSGPVLDATAGDHVDLHPLGHLRLLAPAGGHDDGVRLWRGWFDLPTTMHDHLGAHGRAITYAHSPDRFPLAMRQTVFARHTAPIDSGDPVDGGASAEMASAGRPFTAMLVAELVSRGIAFAPITLHAGVSSLDHTEAPRPEPFEVPEATAAQVRQARGSGRRVVAVGTTVARALETAAASDGTVAAARGWTDLVLGPDRPARVVDGLVTGWHGPRASHLLLLEAVAGPELVARAYRAALDGDYLWHEFGDSCLLLPAVVPRAGSKTRFARSQPKILGP